MGWSWKNDAATQSKPPGFSSSIMPQAINLVHYLPAWTQLSATVVWKSLISLCTSCQRPCFGDSVLGTWKCHVCDANILGVTAGFFRPLSPSNTSCPFSEGVLCFRVERQEFKSCTAPITSKLGLKLSVTLTGFWVCWRRQSARLMIYPRALGISGRPFFCHGWLC